MSDRPASQPIHKVAALRDVRIPVSDGLELSANFFASYVVGRVEFVQRGLYLQAQNAVDEWVLGGELDVRWTATRWLGARLSAGAARTVARRADALAALLGPEVRNPLFPPIQVHGFVDFTVWQLPQRLTAKLSLEASFVGPRAASQSNALLAGRAYDLPSYFYGGASVSVFGTPIGARETRVALRVSNLFDVRYVEPGVGGIDLPAQGRTFFLTLLQQL